MRRRTDPLTAVRSPENRPIELPNGEHVQIKRGDWLLIRGQTVVDWAPSHQLDDHYEILTEGELRIPHKLVQRLELIVGIGAGRDPYVFAEAVERLAAISIGTVRIEFTPGQLDEIKHRAGKRGHTMEQELRAAVDRVKDEIFHRG